MMNKKESKADSCHVQLCDVRQMLGLDEAELTERSVAEPYLIALIFKGSGLKCLITCGHLVTRFMPPVYPCHGARIVPD